MQQFMLFWPFYKARLQDGEGKQSDLKTYFSPIGPEKPPTDEKEFYQFFIHFSPDETPNKDHFSTRTLGNQLMKTLSSWKHAHPNKSLMDVTITKGRGDFVYEAVNMQLHSQCKEKAARYYTVNQAVMDIIATKLILAWDTYSMNFVVHITLHN